MRCGMLQNVSTCECDSVNNIKCVLKRQDIFSDMIKDSRKNLRGNHEIVKIYMGRGGNAIDQRSERVMERQRMPDPEMKRINLKQQSYDVSTEDVNPGLKEDAESILSIVAKLVVALLCGVVFGFAAEKSRVFEPMSIREQMVFEKWIMLKMFLAAVATGQVCLNLLSVCSRTSEKFKKASEQFFKTVSEKGLLTSTLGPFILGIGMTLSGSCPGMVLTQVGAWCPNAIFTLMGALLAALIYGMVAQHIQNFTQPKVSYQSLQVHHTLKRPYILFALPLAGFLTVVVVLLEVYIPFTQDLEKPELQKSNIFETRAWPPFVGGCLIGLLQLPVVLVLGDTIGGSSSYVTLVSQWVRTPYLKDKFPYLAERQSGMDNWWQVIYVIGAVVGGLVSSMSSNSFNDVQGVGVFEALVGGFLIVFGARFASGCTSGHGLSGVGMLFWLSLIAVPFMFGGAISTAYIMRAVNGALDRYVNSTLEL
ncbi:hypothetical protein LOTGIDRAFT_162150 [Lottia gigantea]|uniref:Uncharacterized protein n=1 Tax=Lottia gigantea TaxID=225164 RepID=V4BVR5_LOTGI|nr:hypothetical protein LOTGIDRAFT_162150 [Lottia gigantea]ESO93124.1 hypothetical protein LOTGIDRAFT_162150 [Lottia gigantea]